MEPSVYVVSDAELARYKRKQAEAEIHEIDKLIESHRSSIERLETTRKQLQADLPSADSEEPVKLG